MLNFCIYISDVYSISCLFLKYTIFRPDSSISSGDWVFASSKSIFLIIWGHPSMSSHFGSSDRYNVDSWCFYRGFITTIGATLQAEPCLIQLMPVFKGAVKGGSVVYLLHYLLILDPYLQRCCPHLCLIRIHVLLLRESIRSILLNMSVGAAVSIEQLAARSPISVSFSDLPRWVAVSNRPCSDPNQTF